MENNTELPINTGAKASIAPKLTPALSTVNINRSRNDPTKCESSNKPSSSLLSNEQVIRKSNRKEVAKTSKVISDTPLINGSKHDAHPRQQQTKLEIIKDEQSLSCSLCNINFDSKVKWKFHKYFDHKKVAVPNSTISEPEFSVCDICHRRFRSINNFQKHLKSHDRHIWCKICKRSFASKALYRKDLIQHVQDSLNELSSSDEEIVEDDKQYLEPLPNEIVLSEPLVIKDEQIYAEDSEDDKNIVFLDDFDKLNDHSKLEEPDDVAIIADDEGLMSQDLENNDESLASLIDNNGNSDISSKDSEEDEESIDEIGADDKLSDVYKCVCNKYYTKIRSFKFHLNRKHPIKSFNVQGDVSCTTYYCNLCLESCGTARKLNAHLISNHRAKRDNVFKCRLCEELFENVLKRRDHETETHLNRETNKYQCPKCEKSFSGIWPAGKHFPQHLDIFNVLCEVCGKGLSKLSNLKNHLENHIEDRNFKCDICGHTFKILQFLRNHINKRHSDRRPFKCDLCPAAYKDTSDLKRHKYSHGGYEKTVKCLVCPATFYENRGLRLHMKIHNKATAIL